MGERTLVRRLAERVDVRRLDDPRAALDDARGLAEVARGVLVAREVRARARPESFVCRVDDLHGDRKALGRSAQLEAGARGEGREGRRTKLALSGSACVEEAVGFATPGCMSTPLLPPRVTSVSFRDMMKVREEMWVFESW